MSERALLRIGSLSAIIGAILVFIGNVLHPRTSDVGNVEAELRAIANSTITTGAHIGIFIGALLVLGGLLALYRSITNQPAASWARLGYGAALVSTTLVAAVTALDGIAMKQIADAWAANPAALQAAASALVEVVFAEFSVAIIILFGATAILYGLAVAYSDGYPKWLGWVAFLLGIAGALIGLVQAYQGPSQLVTNVLFVIVSIAFTVWIFIMGVLMWRKASASA